MVELSARKWGWEKHSRKHNLHELIGTRETTLLSSISTKWRAKVDGNLMNSNVRTVTSFSKRSKRLVNVMIIVYGIIAKLKS